MENTTVINTLSYLIEFCRCSHAGYRDASHFITAPEMKEYFGQISKERWKFADELMPMFEKMTGAMEPKGTFVSELHDFWHNLRGSFSERRDALIFEGLWHSDEMFFKAYDDALKMDLPADLRTIIERQALGIKPTLLRMKTLMQGKAATAASAGRSVRPDFQSTHLSA